jgi:hypothetical protein
VGGCIVPMGAVLFAICEARLASCFRASSNSTCLSSIATSFSLALWVGAGFVWVGLLVGYVSMCVVGRASPAVSLPFIVCAIFGFGRVTTFPLVVGRSAFRVMWVSFSGCVYISVRSIRFVVGIWAVGFALVCVLADNPVC